MVLSKLEIFPLSRIRQRHDPVPGVPGADESPRVGQGRGDGADRGLQGQSLVTSIGYDTPVALRRKLEVVFFLQIETFQFCVS